MKKRSLPRWFRWVALSLVGLFSQFLLKLPLMAPTIAQTPLPPSMCSELTTPLTPEEEGYARMAWQYFLNNLQTETGLVNAANQYPSGTLWDMSNYLMALNAVRGLDIVDQADFDYRLNSFLTGLSNLPLFEGKLPNKAYNTATGQMVNYNNEPETRGIGWSALDIGRTLAALHAVRTCHPEYSDWISSIVAQWKIEQSVKEGQLYGAMVSSDGQTILVQEGRLGYEEYAARGYQLWGFDVAEALSLQPLNYVDIYGVQVPVDHRDYQSSGANNYVVSESYILDGIEFGLQGTLADHAAKVFEAQKRHHDATQELTAVSEDNINQTPHFLYNTVYANGTSWATITDQNQSYPHLRTLSTKAAFGWHYLYPNSAYAQQLFDAVKNLHTPNGGGYYAGRYQETQEPNDILTGNTNGLILEILHFKARGNQPLINTTTVATIAPIPPVNNPEASVCPALSALNPTEQQSAEAAWTYFQTNVESTGLVSDRSDLKGTTLWAIGDYVNALNAVRLLNIISADDFDQRSRQLLGALQVLPLSENGLPHRSYDPRSLQPIDYGGNPVSAATGWSALDLGRLMTSLYTLKTCYPQYGAVIDRILLSWSYIPVIQNQQLVSGQLTSAQNETIQALPETRLGYTEYAARAFQLWGFDTRQSEVSRSYQSAQVEGIAVPTARLDSNGTPLNNPYTTADPFVLYGLEFGFDPQMRSLIQPILQAEAARYQRTGTFSASGTTLIHQAPYVVHNTIIGNGQPWAALTDDGDSVPNQRLVSTAIAFGYHALFPDNLYAQQLWQSVAGRFESRLGYFEGYLESNGETVLGLTSSTNSTVLQALLYQAGQNQPLVRANPDRSSPWWQAIAQGNMNQGLPQNPAQPINLISDSSSTFWSSEAIAQLSNPETTIAPAPISTVPPPPVPSPSVNQPLINRLGESDRIAAQRAWTYFSRNWNERTGLVNAVDNLAWTTLWDQGSAMLGIHAGRQLGLVSTEQFQSRIDTLLHTLETLPIPTTGLPNKAYSTATAQMRRLNNTPDPTGSSGWSVLDTARLLVALDIYRTQYPEYGDRINNIVANWNLSKLVNDGWLQGGISSNGGIEEVQEGRLGYEQYAASALQRWGITATKALNEPPVTTIEVEGVSLQVDQRNWQNSNASNHLTSDPYVLWGLELGFLDTTQPQVENLLLAQQNRYERTQILTAVNEDSLDRAPYFLYYSVYADGQPWQAVDVRGRAFPELRALSTKAAFGWAALMPESNYAKMLRDSVQNLADTNRGYLSGRYENSRLGVNRSIDINTNAAILESLLYIAREHRPLADV
jgi:hypothetical protein